MMIYHSLLLKHMIAQVNLKVYQMFIKIYKKEIEIFF